MGITTKTTEQCKSAQKACSYEDYKKPADFETAISVAGFGRFNIFLLLVACPAAMSSVVETAVVSYILPSAECDLNLNLIDKGILNAITYCGMIVSAIAWGYLSDKKGRKKLLVYGYLVDVVCVLSGAMSQNVIQLMVSKFFGGLVMCGPFAVLMSYLTEFHGTQYRPRIMMLIGIMFSTASIALPVLALFILPKSWDFQIFNMNFRSWQVYFAVCCIPSLISGILLTLFPESPRFLMSQGRNAEALKVFQKIYAINKRKPQEQYPIKHLINENPKHKDSDPPDNISIATIEAAIIDSQLNKKHTNDASDNNNTVEPVPSKLPTGLKALFLKPYLGLCTIVNILNFFILLGHNTMRLWLPQLFASLHEYEQLSSDATSMCSILEYSVNKTELVQTSDDTCVVVITPATYSNNIIVAVTGFVAYLVAGSLINALGNKFIQVFGLVIAGTCGIALYWSSSALTTLIITGLYVCMGSISSTSVIGTSVNLFPTSLRTMIVSLSMMFGRMGSITGNVLFPVLMSFGCVPPFVMVGAVMFSMIVSAIAWGYLSDKKGRKKLLVYGYLVDVVCVLSGAMSQNVIQLMVSKFFGGLVMCGPFAVLMSYLTEFHGTQYRPRIMMLIGIMFSTASIALPVLALFILPKSWDFQIFNMNFRSWQVYFAVCCIPSLISGILLTLFPESPRFLMSQGRNAEALKVFQKIYAINKRKPQEQYPIKHLINENPKHKDSDPPDNISIATIEAAIIDSQLNKKHTNDASDNNNTVEPVPSKLPTGLKALFLKPYLGLCTIVNILNFFILLGHNTMRLWLPQLFASLHEYEQLSSDATSMCSILEYSVNKTELVQTSDDTCVVVITPATYSNNIIVAVTGFVAYLVAGSLINALGNKFIQVFGLVIAGTCGIALYWSSSALTTLIITGLYVCMGSISSTSVIGTSVNLFPTSLRTMIVSLSMMFGRMGSITGNVLFPVLMSFGCVPPFVMVGAVMFIGAILSASLPSTTKIQLK